MIEDLIGGEDDDSGSPIGPALVLPAPMGPCLLVCEEQMHRMDDRPAANTVIFTSVNEDGVEIWDPPLPGRIAEEKRWQAIMGWPVPPTIPEAEAFLTNARLSRLAAWWERLKAAKAEDDAERPVSEALKPNGRQE